MDTGTTVKNAGSPNRVVTFRPRGVPLYEIIPEYGAYTFSVASPANTQPVWNVRIVSWVPGSPID